jgi:hypothetical protein
MEGKRKGDDDPKHPQKKAVDAFGGDPLNPNDAMLERIAHSIDGGKKDDMVHRWASACVEVCDDPAGKPKRMFLLEIANGVLHGKKSGEVKEWAAGKRKPVPQSPLSLNHLDG